MFWRWWTTTESSKGRATGELSQLRWCNHLPVHATVCEEMLYKQSLASWVTFMSAVIPALPCMLQVSIFKKAISIPRILAGWNVTTLTFSGLSLSQLLSVFWLYDKNMLQMLFSISGNTHGILNENGFFFSQSLSFSSTINGDLSGIESFHGENSFRKQNGLLL